MTPDLPELARPHQDAAAGVEVEVVRPERFCFGTAVTAAAAGQVRILILDTHAHLAAITAAMLTDLGYAAQWCLDSRDVIDHLEREPRFDLLLAPALNPTLEAGFALARSAQARQPHLRIVLTHGSSHAPLQGTRGPGDSPTFERLAKPYSQTKLHHKVRQVLAAKPAA